MLKEDWAIRIKRASNEAGTYKPVFDDVIDTLAGILEQRDNLQAEFDTAGGSAIVYHTNKGGSTNPTKNPAVVLINDLNKTALAYWRDLGLTPAGLKRLADNAINVKSDPATLGDVLKNIGI